MILHNIIKNAPPSVLCLKFLFVAILRYLHADPSKYLHLNNTLKSYSYVALFCAIADPRTGLGLKFFHYFILWL